MNINKRKIMNTLFWITANLLNQIAKWTGLTYNEINIIVYYLIIPLTWTVMLDIIIGIPLFTSLLILAWMYILAKIRTKRNFRIWCDWFFMKSRDFLLYFKRIGWNYVVSSVIICVIVPVIIYGLLIWGLILRL